ncbi:hypothetical protein [Streptomyces cyslabdanicus]|uniref:hypothetical protein n=1 Tax=Streptomyces cyslabdanicus TaxID=1470456 RepID=UPI0040445036
MTPAAEKSGSAHLAASANGAYVHAMSLVLLVCGVASLVAALPAAVFLPGAGTAAVRDEPERSRSVIAPEPDAGQ